MAHEECRFFRNHWQPEINERLNQIFNFLADEDVYNCIDFERKFSKIEEYIEYISQKRFPCDLDKLEDVKVMCQVHRDVIGVKNKGLPKGNRYINSVALKELRKIRRKGQLASYRLIDQNEINIYEHEEGPREDLAPFSLAREYLPDGFEVAFKADWSHDANDVDEGTNLVYVENRAYVSALRNPTSIPFMLRGPEVTFCDSSTDKSTQKLDEEHNPESLQKLLSAGFTIPVLQRVKKTEVFMNDCLKRWEHLQSGSDYWDFIQLLKFYSPDEIKNLRNEKEALDRERDRLSWRRFAELERWLDNNGSKYEELIHSIELRMNKWIDKLKQNGVSLTAEILDGARVVTLEPRSEPLENLPKQPIKLRLSPHYQHPDDKVPDAVDVRGFAEIRGTRRGAIELALNLLATNEEQYRPNQRFRKVDLPSIKPQKLEESPLCLSLKPADRPVEEDPFKFTKATWHLRRSLAENYASEKQKEGNLEKLLPGLIPAVQHGPFFIPDGPSLCGNINKRLQPLLKLQDELNNAQKDSSRPFIYHLMAFIDDARKPTKDVSTQQSRNIEPLSRREFQRLKDLTEPIAVEGKEHVEISDFGSTLDAGNIADKANLPEFKRLIQTLEKVGDIPALADQLSSLFLSMGPSAMQRIALIQGYFEKLAVKLGRNIRNLEELLNRASQSSEIQAYIQRMRSGTFENKSNESLIGLANEVLQRSPELGKMVGIGLESVSAMLTAAQAAKLVQIQIARETRNNWDYQFAEKEDAWEFALSLPVPEKPLFHLYKWKTESKTQERVRFAGDVIRLKEKRAELAEQNRQKRKREEEEAELGGKKLRERYFAGPNIFPFGETPYHRAAQNFSMNQDLKNGMDPLP